MREKDPRIDKLVDLVIARIIEKYGDISPLNFLANQEEILISELARLNTVLLMLEDQEAVSYTHLTLPTKCSV